MDCDIKSPWKHPFAENITDEAVFEIERYERGGTKYCCLYAYLKWTPAILNKMQDFLLEQFSKETQNFIPHAEVLIVSNPEEYPVSSNLYKIIDRLKNLVNLLEGKYIYPDK